MKYGSHYGWIGTIKLKQYYKITKNTMHYVAIFELLKVCLGIKDKWVFETHGFGKRYWIFLGRTETVSYTTVTLCIIHSVTQSIHDTVGL